MDAQRWVDVLGDLGWRAMMGMAKTCKLALWALLYVVRGTLLGGCTLLVFFADQCRESMEWLRP